MINLNGSDKLVTKQAQISYRVESGSVYVFLSPLGSKTSLRQMYVGQADVGSIIPGFLVTEAVDGEDIIWTFLISPKDRATLSEITKEANHETEFLPGINYKRNHPNGVVTTSNMFRCLLEDYYYLKELEEDKVYKARDSRKKSQANNIDIIKSAFTTSREVKTIRDIDAQEELYTAMTFLCKYKKMDIAPYEKIKSIYDEYTVEDIARLSGFDVRKINIPDDFMRIETGPLIVFLGEERRPVVMFEKSGHKKFYYDPRDLKIYKLDAANVNVIDREGIQIYRPLGDKAFTGKEFFKFARNEIDVRDMIFIVIGMLLVTLTSVALSSLNQKAYDRLIPHGDSKNLIDYGLILLAFMIASLLYTIAQGIASFRLNSKLKYSLQASVYGRIFRMQESYYRQKDSAELAYRTGILSSCYISVFNNITIIILQLVFSIFYFERMMSYSIQLGRIGLIIAVVNALIAGIIGFSFQRLQSKRSQLTGKIRSYLYQMFSGISTIRLAGAEETILSEYNKKAAEFGAIDYEYNYVQRLSTAINSAMGCISTVLIYHQMSTGGVRISIGAFMGFVSIYGCFTAAFMQVSNSMMMIFRMRPILKNSSDVLNTPPESASSGVLLPSLNGKIEVNNLTFGYKDSNADILNNVSFTINPGEYVGIVGGSGCGKSTLLRLLLGFESPKRGVITYDDNNLASINKVQLRRQFGVVLQDGGLFSGSIYKNIKVCAPGASIDDINEAIEAVGLREIIDQMPMGIMTPVTEQAYGLSGGQRQRILIARAIAAKPKIIFMDEATSALDNASQAKVSESIAKLKATRIVVAHRLSTVMACDKILVLDKGRIAEIGNYSELIERKGVFYELVRKQMLAERG